MLVAFIDVIRIVNVYVFSIGYSSWGIICTVWPVEHDAYIHRRPPVIPVPRSRNIYAVIRIDEATMVGKTMMPVIVNIHITNHRHHSERIIVDINVSSLYDPSVVIIINRDIFDLDHRPIVIILHIRFVVVTRIVTDVQIW